jgi:acetolactate synthase-1/2/3 large subunit
VRVSDYIVKHLESIGVDKVFLLSGGGMMHLLDAVSRSEKIQYICNHHEQASGMAADAYARVSGKLGVCFATSGPGGTNTLTAVVGAYQDSSPVLFVTGQSKVSQTIEGTNLQGLRQFGTFEVDVIPTVKSVTKYAAIVLKAEDIRYHLEKAIYLAMNGRPGSVFLDIPVDIQGAPVDPEEMKGFDPSEIGIPSLKIANDEIDNILSRIKKAKKPLILAGQGVRASSQIKKFRELVNKLQIPVVTTCFGNDVLEYNHHLFVGHPGMKGDRAGNFAVQTADFILTLGSSLHVTTTGYELDQFAPNAYKVLIDPDDMVHKREQLNLQKKIHCDLKTFFNNTLNYIEEKKLTFSTSPWNTLCTRWKDQLSVYKEPHAHVGSKINFYDFIEKLDIVCGDDDIIVSDAGSAFYIIGQAFRVKQNQRVISSGSLGAMGFALPASSGAAASSPSKQVICVTGDGSLQTNIHELAVIRKNNLNVKLFIVNNDGYVCIRNTQNNFFKGHLAGTSNDSGVFIPSTEKIAAAYELPYLKATEISELDSVISKALNTQGPVICEIFTPPNQEILPTVSSIKLENGSMKSKPLHDMYPFMSEEERNSYLAI